MIPLNEEQRLGRKAYLLMASRKMMPGLALLLIAAVLLAASGTIAGFIYRMLAESGQNTAHAAAMVSGGMMEIVLGLFLASVVVMLVGLVIARLEYANYTYSFEEFGMHMRRGILRRTETSLLYRQIQDVDIDRSLLHQFLGLSKLTIITAGHEEATEHEKAEVILEPIEKSAAEEIRAMLERKIGVQVVKTEAQADTAMGGMASAVPPISA